MKAIKNCTVLTPYGELHGKAVLFDEKIIDIIDENNINDCDEIIDAKGRYLSPGFVDVHVHGYLGEDTSDGSEEGIRIMAKGMLKNGVTSFLPTTMTVSWSEIETAFKNIRTLKPLSQSKDFEGSEILGCHAEGPFINPSKKGAQREECIIPPDIERTLQNKDIIKIITIAPEMEGGIEYIKQVTQKSDIVVSIGHTNADFDTAMSAIKAGASHITHLFNAMTALNHRNPGVVGAALSTDVYAELIADCFHIHPGIFSILKTIKNDKLVLITDCTRAGGLEDGEYSLGGQAIFVKGIECRLADGTIAGSVLKLNNAVNNYKNHAKISLYEAVNAASLNAAASIGEDKTKGSIENGKDADLVIMDENCNVFSTFVRGTMKYNKEK